MPSSQKQPNDDLRILRILDREEELDHTQDYKIIQRIAKLWRDTPEFDSTHCLIIINRAIKEAERHKRIRIFAQWGSLAAAIVLAVLLFLPKPNFHTAKKQLVGDSRYTELLIPRHEIGSHTITVSSDKGSKYGLKESPKGIRLRDLISSNPDLHSSRSIQVDVPATQQVSFILEDGSSIKLNFGSSISIPTSFPADSRSVTLNYGEAFFDVARDPERPMSVITPQMDICVLGTVFDVKAYRSEPSYTTLVEGCIQVQDRDGNTLTLHPNNQAILDNGGLESHSVDARIAVAWVNGEFIFDTMPLSQIMAHLERQFDFSTTYASPDLKERTYTGAFRKNFTRDYIFSLLEKTTNLNVVQNEEERKVTLTSR